MYALLAGALAPLPLWYYQRRFPDTRFKYINLPVLLNGPSAAPPATGVNYASFFILGFIFREYLVSLFMLFPGRRAPALLRISIGEGFTSKRPETHYLGNMNKQPSRRAKSEGLPGVAPVTGSYGRSTWVGVSMQSREVP